MKHLLRPLALLVAIILSACATSRSAFTPESGPPTVGMPAELSQRERLFIPDLESSLRNQGYLPVRHGAGDYQLEFQMAEGPINTDTSVELYEGRHLVAQGKGRAAGAPLIGRSKVAQTSFDRAFQQFQSSLPGTSRGPVTTAPAADEQYIY